MMLQTSARNRKLMSQTCKSMSKNYKSMTQEPKRTLLSFFISVYQQKSQLYNNKMIHVHHWDLLTIISVSRICSIADPFILLINLQESRSSYMCGRETSLSFRGRRKQPETRREYRTTSFSTLTQTQGMCSCSNSRYVQVQSTLAQTHGVCSTTNAHLT